jgi:DNA-binding cell septation regulator SpoVG
VIHGLVLRINKQRGYSLHMPQRKRANGMHADMALPLDNETRRVIEEKVFAAYQVFANEPVTRPVSK